MITILSLKTPSGRATDAVDNLHHNIFRHLSDEVQYIEAQTIVEKFMLLWKVIPDYMLGIGSVEEIIYLFFKPKKTKYIISWHTLLRKTKVWPLRRILFKKVSYIFTVSECAARTIEKHAPKTVVFPIIVGVDTEFFKPEKANREFLQAKFGIDVSKSIILFVGALSRRKRPDVFLKIAKRVPDAHFVLVGKKAESGYLDFLKEGRKGNVFWIPYMSREEMTVIMASSDVFLFPSVNEPSAAVVPEALASGLPVLLSKSCGNEEIVAHGKEGFLIEVGPREEDEFIIYLKKFLENHILYETMRKNAREKATRELDWRYVAGEYKKILKRFV